MPFRTPANIRKEFAAHPRRALIITTVIHESRAVKAHLTNPETVIGEKGAFYEFGRFSDPAGDWLVVHAITAQGNSDAGLVVSKAYQEFGNFHAQIFVGVAGSLKEDIPVGSVVVGDYVYNGHSAKVEDEETRGRPHGIPPARELLTAAQGLIYSDEWQNLIRSPVGTELPSQADYPCDFPPAAFIKGIVSGEEIVAGGRSQRYIWLRTHFNDCGAVEMEGWGVMNAAHHENASAIVVRGISDLCAGKDHGTDRLHQPIAAAHAAAFAFSILSFRSKVPAPDSTVLDVGTPQTLAVISALESSSHSRDRRVDVVFNFKGSREDWSQEKAEIVVERLREAFGDREMTLVRIDVGSVRLVMRVREADVAAIDFAHIREITSVSGATLLGAAPMEMIEAAEKAKAALAAASANLLAWEKMLPNGRWIARPEEKNIAIRFQLETSSTVLLGEPGSGKSALVSKIAADLLEQGATVFAIKSDFLSTGVRSEADLQHELQLPDLPSDLILLLSKLEPVYVFIDQLDALASQLDLQSGRLNVLLNLIRRIGSVPNVHILLSARVFEFNHDVRLRSVHAEPLMLALPPLHEVKVQLAEVGIDTDGWPEKAREVVRIPQALKTFIALVRAGRTEPFTTYQAMLEQLWRERVAMADDSENLIALASDLAGRMAEEEALWLAAARFDDRLISLKKLEAVGFIVRSENDLSVAFSHQTIFDYVLARTFVRNTGLLSAYVLERQDSLFVRPKVWSALNYLRESDVKSYERELLAVWKTTDLRKHLRILLIEFLGQVKYPLEFERACMVEVLTSKEFCLLGLKAIGQDSPWFVHFSSTAIRDAMVGSEAEVRQALRILSLNWNEANERIVSLVTELWLPHPERDYTSWMVLDGCPVWNDHVEEIAVTILKRTPISIWQVDSLMEAVAVKQPEVAARLVGAKLDYLLAEAFDEPQPAPSEMVEEDAWRFEYSRTRKLGEILEAAEWNGLTSLAEAAPSAFLDNLWPRYQKIFSEIISESDVLAKSHIYPKHYVADVDLPPSKARAESREKPLIAALQLAIKGLTDIDLKIFLDWAEVNSTVEIMPVQQLIAIGYRDAADRLAQQALEWLLLDLRRFQLGNSHGHRRTTIELIRSCVPYWSQEEIARFERSVIDYRPSVPEHVKGLEQRRLFADIIRATKKDLLQAIGVDRISEENQDLVATEQRALGDRFDRSIGEIEVSWVGSPMEAGAMTKAKDRDILKILREIPDSKDWDHPTRSMRGGNIQLSRAFSEFSRGDPDRAMRLMDQFEPTQQERAAGYALDAMADDAANDHRVVEAVRYLHARGFAAEEFRDSGARALEKIADRKVDVGDDIIGILTSWLRVVPVAPNAVVEEALKSGDDFVKEDLKEGSVLWGLGGASSIPSGNFSVLSALASILLNRNDAGRDRYFEVLNEHLSREPDPDIWRALLYRIGNAGGSKPQVVSNFIRKLFDRFPELLATREAIIFLAYAQRWDDQLVFDLIGDWPNSVRPLMQRAFGELVGLVAIAKHKERWDFARRRIIESGTEDMKIGLAHAAVNMWSDNALKAKANGTLISLLKNAKSCVVAAVMDLFRIIDELVPDALTVELLRALADPDTDMSIARSYFVVERLQSLLPHEAELVARIAYKLLSAWRGELGDMRTGAASAAPQLTDLALTLHRLGGPSRQSGVDLFEIMIEIDAYGARDTLAEIDGRFYTHQGVVRRRLPRRRSPRALRSTAA